MVMVSLERSGENQDPVSGLILTQPGKVPVMSTNAFSLGHEPGALGSVPTSVLLSMPWRARLLRVLAAAHVVVGLMELSRVAGNLLLQVRYPN